MGLFGSSLGLPQALSGLMQQRRPREDDPYSYMPEQSPLQGISDLGTRLMAAQAAIDGDFGGAVQLNASVGAEQRAMAQQAAKAQAERADWVWKKQYEAQNRKPDGPPSFVKNLEAWRQMTPQQQAEVAQMQSVLNPGWMTGQDGLPYQRGPAQVPQPAPWQQNPDDWEMVPGPQAGGAGPQAPRGFPSNIPSGSPLQRPYRR